jgi:peptide-methionine (S)-S-oxide reductase
VYEQVTTGTTGHAESVEIVFDPRVISYGQILHIFFSVVHDPTEVDRQGPDDGPQYRSNIFYRDDDQRRVARAYIDQLEAAKVYPLPIATRLDALQTFYWAEDNHQNYLALHPDDLYIVVNDLPKLAALHFLFPDRYRVPSGVGT